MHFGNKVKVKPVLREKIVNELYINDRSYYTNHILCL